jgi:hypothetical protein
MDESRKQFEEWFMDDVVGAAVDFPGFEDGEYVAGEVYDEQLYVMLQAMYMAWTASRAAIEIKLDAHTEFEIEHMAQPEEDGYAKGWIDGRNYGEKQIRAAGIKVKE